MTRKSIRVPAIGALIALFVSLPINAGAQGQSSPGQSPPVNTALPSISGTAAVGQTLSANAGTWEDSQPSTFAYQWLSCDSGGGSCGAIGSATGTSYTVTSGLAGATVRVAVTATNKNGSTVATSNAAGPVPGGTTTSTKASTSTSTTGSTSSTTSGTPAPQPGYTFCSYEYAQCSFSGSMQVIYGANGTFTAPQVFTGGVACGNATFGDPTPGTVKHCETAPATGTTTTTTTQSSGCSAPTNPVSNHWYSCSAAVNTPIPANPPISPYNSALMANFVPQGSNVWNQYFIGPRNREVVAYPTSSTPTVTIQVNFPTCNKYTVTVPIPSATQLTPANNENYLVVMLPNGDQWDFWNISKPGVAPYNAGDWGGSGTCSANGNWQAIEALQHSPGWTSGGTMTGGGSESGTFEGYGAIRLLDTQQTPTGGNWGHALGWTGFDNCASSNSSGLPRYVAPATEGNGSYSNAGCFPMGTRWQLDPSINCNTWPSMANQAEWLKQMCRTLQVYGMIDVHSTLGQGDGDGFRTEYSPNFTNGQLFPWQDSSGNWPDAYSPALNLPPDLISHFRVIDWTRWTG